MQQIMLKSKLHQARVTDVLIDYEGSIEIDEDLLDQVGILTHEQVHVFNINNAVKLGDLDFILIKPINSQFFISCRYVNSYALISILLLSLLLIKLTYTYHGNSFIIANYIFFSFTWHPQNN